MITMDTEVHVCKTLLSLVLGFVHFMTGNCFSVKYRSPGVIPQGWYGSPACPRPWHCKNNQIRQYKERKNNLLVFFHCLQQPCNHPRQEIKVS